VFARLKARAATLRREVLTLWFCARHPRTPLAAKLLAALVAAYALSPIDLIPDFIPVLGYLDDLILVPAGVCLALRLVPADVIAEARARAEAAAARPPSYAGAAAVVLVWLVLAGWAWTVIRQWL
jgi:uncharacterized membrane protein YkvA (DUF1232 family)